MKQTITVLITDLDNTLFDWVDIWYKSFKAMLDQLVVESGVSEDLLLREFKTVHEKHGTSEYAFSIEELPSLQKKYPDEDLAKRFEGAISAYREARKASLCLYPDVRETLEVLKDKGCLLVGYTESMSFYSWYRVRNLGLDRILDYLYSPPDHELPRGASPRGIRRYPQDYYELRRTVHRHVLKGEAKPNPRVLLDIIRGIGASPSETVYVGDSLMKDVAMAGAAKVTSAWAKYGVAQHRKEYELLRKVTHWTAADVEREKNLRTGEVKPSYTLETGFGELLTHAEFGEFLDRSQSKISVTVELWKKTVDVQQHFNDLELRIRNFALTVLAAMLGFAAYAVRDNLQIMAFGYRLSVAEVLLPSSIFLWLAFYFMDRFWYHRLLYGAVDHGRSIENRWKRELPEIALTDSIGRFSPLKIGRLTIHTPHKIDLFYCVGVAFLLILSLLTHFVVRPTTTTAVPQPPVATRVPNINDAPRLTGDVKDSNPTSVTGSPRGGSTVAK
jgi:phosphoglycolate phosphatase-like HAD superfamily hydrolase